MQISRDKKSISGDYRVQSRIFVLLYGFFFFVVFFFFFFVSKGKLSDFNFTSLQLVWQP